MFCKIFCDPPSHATLYAVAVPNDEFVHEGIGLPIEAFEAVATYVRFEAGFGKSLCDVGAGCFELPAQAGTD